MPIQQSSFDFFNVTPEEQQPAGPADESTVANKPGEKKVEEHAAKIKDDDKDEQKTIAEEPTAELQEAAVIIVDEEVRDVAFIATPKPAPAKSVANPGKTSTRGRMKLSDMDVVVGLVEVPEDEVLFQKRYYPISAVADMFKVNISLIRFWENEFDILKPKKNGKGDRLFRPEDIKNLQLIYLLLREKKYTIDGARDFIKKNKKAEESFAIIDTLKKTKAFLLELKANL